MTFSARIEAAELAAREASAAPWRADGRTVLDARGEVVAIAQGEDEAQARRNAVAIAACLSLVGGGDGVVSRMRHDADEAVDATKRAARTLDQLEKVDRSTKRTISALRDQLRAAGMEPAA